MSAERVKAHYIVCDQCGVRSLPGETKRGVARLARRLGWDLGRGNIADLCPGCAGPVRRDLGETASDDYAPCPRIAEHWANAHGDRSLIAEMQACPVCGPRHARASEQTTAASLEVPE